MTKKEKLEHFYTQETPWKTALATLRTYLKSTALKEDWKWSFPTYTLDGQNVVSTASFKNHFGLWFFQGALLRDPLNKLHNAQEGKTKAMRHLHFNSIEELEMNRVKNYINEAIALARDGKKVAVVRTIKKITLPIELKNTLLNDTDLNTSFVGLSPSKQREYSDYIHEAKQEATKQRRLKKIIPMILEGKGLNDKYR